MRNRISGKGKRGFSSVVGSVFMVLIMSVLASCYFVYTLSQNTAYNTAVGQKNQLDQSVRSENLQCLNTTYTAFNDTNVNIDFGIQNVGSTSVQFIAIWISVIDPYSDWSGYNFKNLTKPLQPGNRYGDSINLTVAGLNSTHTYSYASWLVTSRGNRVTLQTLKLSNNIIVSQTTQGIGAIMMDFQNFTYYNVTKPGQLFHMDPYPDGGSAYSVNGAMGTGPNGGVAFRIVVTNLDLKQRIISLNPSSVFFIIFPTTGAQPRGAFWYIVNIDAAGYVQQNYASVVLSYDVATPIYFASSNMISGSTVFSPQWSAYAGTAAVNLALIGKIGSDNFGQNIPFVSVYINS